MAITNPYSHIPDEDRDKLYTRVDPVDYRWLLRKIPYTKNLTANILATQFKALIDELRRIDSANPIVPALYPGDPTYQLVESVLGRCNFRPDSGSSSGPDDAGGTSSVHAEVFHSTQQQPVKKSRTPRRSRGGEKVKRTSKKLL